MSKLWTIILFASLCWIMTGCATMNTETADDPELSSAGGHQIKAIYVVVHKDNPITTLTKAELKKIYLGTQSRWPNLLQIERYDYPPAQDLFYEKVLELPMVEVNRHWNQQKIMGGYRPPITVKRVRELLALFQRESGGIAYITTKNIPKTVKVVAEFPIAPTVPNITAATTGSPK